MLDSSLFKTFIEDWIINERSYEIEKSIRAFSSDEQSSDASVKCLGRANGLQLCRDRIQSLRNLCTGLIAQEVENLKQSGIGGVSDATL